MSSYSSKSSSETLGLVIVDGVGFKNFILSDFLQQASRAFGKVVIFSGLPASAYKLIINEDVEIVELPLFIESRSTWFWRKMKEVAHMQQYKKEFFGIAANLEKNKLKDNSKRAKLISLIFKITSVFNSEKWISKYYNNQIKSTQKNSVSEKYLKLLLDSKIKTLFFTHQRPPYLAVLDKAAKDLEITTCSFIFSWDNLASKGRMAAPFDSYLVWSELMRSELHYFYPDTENKTVIVVGTPQFEPYILKQYGAIQSEFEEKFNLDHHLKTICYSCGDVSTSKSDTLYIETIAQAIKNEDIPKVNLLVRTSPAEDGSRFEATRKKYPFIIWNFPNWNVTRTNHPELWSQRVPEASDLKDLRMILEFSDLGINMCSTMSLDFMIFDKPVINPVFGNEDNGLYNDQKYLKYAHYERVVKSGAVAIAKNAEELINAINFTLENPEARLKEQRELLKLQIGKPLEGTSLRIAKALKEIS